MQLLHPTNDRLVAFALGTVATAETQEIADHLETCPVCCARLEESRTEDVFVARIRLADAARDPEETQAYGPLAAEDTAVDLPTSIGSYRIERELGHGGMGRVYLAHDDRLHRAIALKIMRSSIAAQPKAAARFLREARAAAQIEHDNVVPIWQVGEDRGIPFIAMPYLRGESLAQRLRREPVSPPELILQVGREVAEGLAAAHYLGLIHRDIKPDNIWLEADAQGRVRRCKILDFGLARSGNGSGGLTSAKVTVGSPGYMAPEQARGLSLDGRADLFGLGAVLYRMATGRLPFEGPTLWEVLAALATRDPVRPDCLGCPPGLPDLILRLLAKAPTDRPASARELASAISQLRPVVANTEVVARPNPPRNRRHWKLAAIALVAVIAAGAVVIKIRQPDGKETILTVPSGSTVSVDAKGLAVVELPKVPAAIPGNADRQAAEWVRKCGGRLVLEVGTAEATIGPSESLPDGPWFVIGIDLFKSERMTDDGMACLSGLTRLRSLRLESTAVSDAGLAHLHGLTGLTSVSLADCPRVTDVGLISLQKIARLVYLNLHGVSLTDSGLPLLAVHAQLTRLNLSATPVTDDGLSHIKPLVALQELHLANTSITGRGLASLEGLPNLARLYLSDTAAEDAQLEPISKLTRLTHLSLIGCIGVTDTGLAHLSGLTRLSYLNLHGSSIAGDGLRHLYGLSELDVLNLSVTPVADDHLIHLKKIPALRELHLYKTSVTDSGLKHVRGCPKLTKLVVGATNVTDEGLKDIGAISGLTYLDLARTQVTDGGLAHLKDLTGLTGLVLHATKLTGPGLTQLVRMAEFVYLDLSDTTISATALEALKGLSKLRDLRVARTQVTASDAERLRLLLPSCKITGVSSPSDPNPAMKKRDGM